MGQDLIPRHDAESIRRFTHVLLRDIAALERMIGEGRIESGVRRIGCEQEFFLLDRGWRPAPVAMEVLAGLGEAFTTEIARFNLEANLEPLPLAGDSLHRLEVRLSDLLEEARAAARAHDADVVITGILPTLDQSHLSLANMTPRPRYQALDAAIRLARGGKPQPLRIEGIDELVIEQDSVMLESCNTSCQIHLQVSADEFAASYNAAQAVLAPVLAAAVNSPLLFGRRLWAETRIALFQQAVDSRNTSLHLREMSPRVRFGDQWLCGQVTELFHEDLARFRVLLATTIEEDALEVLDRGGVPKLRALQLFNGTLYRWNRPCYGTTDGKPHLRIECRAIPAGPTVADEVANAAFWLGAVLGVVETYGDIAEVMEFDEARANFLAAARLGLRASFTWMGGPPVHAPKLILETLLPLARVGLAGAGVDPVLIDRYLGIMEARVETGQTGAEWLIRSLSAMKDRGTRAERLSSLVAATARLQRDGGPVHTWPLAGIDETGGWQDNYMRVEQYMTTRLVTVNEDDQAEMVAYLLNRKGIRHVLVEDAEHRLVGVVSFRSLIALLSGGESGKAPGDYTVREIMDRDPVTVSPETPTLEAIRLLREHRLTCLPVLKAGRLVGMISERDFLPIAYRLLEQRLTGGD